MKTEDWDDLQPKFRDAVLREQHQCNRTMEDIAAEIPCARAQVYKAIGNQLRRPSLVFRAAVVRFVESRDRRSEGGEPTT